MTGFPGLRLLDYIVEDHHHDRGGDPLLIPCLHEELERDVSFLAAGAQRAGGALFFLNSPDKDWEPPKAPISAHRSALVEGLLASAAGALPAPVIIEQIGDGVVARLKGHTVPEPSLTPILRAAAVIASAAFDDFELVLTAAVFAPADPSRRELLWDLITIDPTDLGLQGVPTTLVPIVGAAIDPETDYKRTPAIRYAVRWDRVISRNMVSQALAVKTIADGLDDRPLVLFLGAGASASSGIRLGNYYRDLALENMVGKRGDSAAAARAFFDLLGERRAFLPGESRTRQAFTSELTLERVLLEVFRDLEPRPRSDAPIIRELIGDCAAALSYVRAGRKAIRALAARLPGRLIVMTVNFDQLVETDLGVPRSIYFKPQHFRDGLSDLLAYVGGDSSKPVPVLKLHGSIEDPQSLITTIDTTSAGFHKDVHAALTGVLGAVAKPLRWVWVGCSMRDRDMNLWLGGLEAGDLDEWWVDPMPGQALDTFVSHHRAPRWRTMGRRLEDRLIIDSADAFLRALAHAVVSGA